MESSWVEFVTRNKSTYSGLAKKMIQRLLNTDRQSKLSLGSVCAVLYVRRNHQ